MPTVAITSFHVQGPDGQDAYPAGSPVTIWAQCASEHDQQLVVDGSFSLSNGDEGVVQVALGPGDSEWLSWQSSPLPAGGYDSTVTLSGELESSSALFDSTGMSFEVVVPAPVTPSVEVVALALQPHTNVEHDDGTAWSDDPVRASAHVANRGGDTGPVQVTIWSSDGQAQTFDTELAAGEERWFSAELSALPAGSHQVSAAVVWEAESSSEVLSQLSRDLAVTDRGPGWIIANVQVRVNDFRGEPLRGYRVFLRFIGMDGSDYYGGETVEASEAEHGVLTCPGIHLQPEGTAQVMAVSEGDPRPLLEGQEGYRLAEGDTNLAFTATQGVTERTYSAHTAAEVGTAVTSEFSAGVEIEIIEIGGSVATEQSRSRTYGEAEEWKVRVGLTNLAITQTS